MAAAVVLPRLCICYSVVYLQKQRFSWSESDALILARITHIHPHCDINYVSFRSVSGSSRPVSCLGITSNQWWRSMWVDRPTGQGSRGETTPSLMRYCYFTLTVTLYDTGLKWNKRIRSVLGIQNYKLSTLNFSLFFFFCFVFLQMFFYNVHMLPSDLFDENISFRVSTIHISFEVLSSVSV